MADPQNSDGRPVEGRRTSIPVTVMNSTLPGSSGSSGSAVTIADGANVTEGTIADAAVAAGAAGTISAKLRSISRDIVANIVLAAGANIIGKVGVDQTTPGTTNRVEVGKALGIISTPTLSVAGSYATGDYIGPTTTPASFANAVRISAEGGVVESVTIIDKTVAAAAVALELWLFSATFTAPTDNAAWSISDADALNCVGVVEIPSAQWYASALNRVFTAKGLGIVVQPAATSIFYALVARGTTPTWANGDLQLTLGMLN